MVVRAARNRFQSSLLSFLGRRGPSCCAACQRANSASSWAVTCFHCAFAGSCAASASASATSASRSHERLGRPRPSPRPTASRSARRRCRRASRGGRSAPRGRRRRWPSRPISVRCVIAFGDILRRGAAADALLEQADLAGELGELALVVGERLFGGARRDTGRRRARRPPRGRRRCRRRRRGPTVPARRSPRVSPCCRFRPPRPERLTSLLHGPGRGRGYWSVTLVIVVGTSGAPVDRRRRPCGRCPAT